MKRVRFTEERIIAVLREHEAGVKTGADEIVTTPSVANGQMLSCCLMVLGGIFHPACPELSIDRSFRYLGSLLRHQPATNFPRFCLRQPIGKFNVFWDHVAF